MAHRAAFRTAFVQPSRAAFKTSSSPFAHSARRMSTDKPGSSRLTPATAVIGLAGLGLGVWFLREDIPFLKDAFAKKPELKSALDKDNFVEFPLKKIIPYNHNTSTFVFELPEGTATLLPVASCVVVKSDQLTDAKSGKPVIRPYTPVSPGDTPGELTLIVKKYDTGVASKFIHELKPGDKLAFKGPIPKFPYTVNEFDEVALIGGGSGITPLYQILEHALPDKTDKTKFKLLFANVTEADILLRETLDGWKKQYPDKFDVVYVLDKPPTGWTGPSGYISKDLLKMHLAPPSLNEKVKVFICGPPPQVASIAGKKEGMKQGALGGHLKALGYTEEQVYKF